MDNEALIPQNWQIVLEPQTCWVTSSKSDSQQFLDNEKQLPLWLKDISQKIAKKRDYCFLNSKSKSKLQSRLLAEYTRVLES